MSLILRLLAGVFFSFVAAPFAMTEEGPVTTTPAAAKSAESPKAEKPKASGDKQTKDEAKAAPAKTKVRLLELSGNYVDQIQATSFDPTSLLSGSATIKQRSFYKLCEHLTELVEDDAIQFVVFDLSDNNFAMNTAQIEEFTRRMPAFKKAKKRTIAWLENASNDHLSIAACCDHVILADFGGVDMPSASLETLFYRDAMDLVGVKASVVRAGDFKGAVEPYLNDSMSEHLRAHYLEMLESINDAAASRLAKGRGLTTAEVREMQKKRMLLSKQALAKGLVDQLAPFGAMKATVEKYIGEDVDWVLTSQKPKKEMSFFEIVGMVMAGAPEKSSKLKQDAIVVLHMTGDIIDGKKQSAGSIVSGPMVESIKALEDDEKVKAVVVRINSPGGSATASEVIRQALASLAKKKPTIISMGSMAASGGYWISCINQPIYAECSTVTGSIGVFAMKLSFGSLMRRVGIKVESITLDDSAASFAIDRDWDDSDVATLQESIDDVYGRFLKLVSVSRDIPVEKVKALAGGRVWSGEQAKSHGLVDSIGGLDDCLAAVAKKADLETYKVIHRPTASAGFDLMELLGESEEEEILSGTVLNSLMSVLKSRGIRIDTTLMLLNDSAAKVNTRPTIWALHPAEISIR